MSGMKDLFGDEPVPPGFGTAPHKLHRPADPITSAQAARRVKSGHLERMVLQAIARHVHGCIASDLLAEFPHHPYSSITARFAALKEKNLITAGPDKRIGRSGSEQMVMRITELGINTFKNFIGARENHSYSDRA